MSSIIVPQQGKKLRHGNIITAALCGISAYICVIPLFLIDIFTIQFQFVYFGLQGIPKLKRSDFFSIDRHLLRKLTLMQKLSCIYCEYANGVVAYVKAVVNQMELYSCAINHLHRPAGHEHQQHFYDRKKFS